MGLIMKTPVLILRGLILPLAMIASPPLRAAGIEEEVPAKVITVTASSVYSAAQAARHLVDGSAMQGGLHDNNASAQTMWHSIQQPAPTSAAAGLPTITF